MASVKSIDLLSFGETMIRLAPQLGTRLGDATSLRLTIGGTESNVAVALASLGRTVAWVSALADHPLGQRIDSELRARRVDTSRVVWQPAGRVGVYYLDVGVEPRPTRVYYDRAGSAVAELAPDALDPSMVREARALHLTGITPALSSSCAKICDRLSGAAEEAGVPLVFDVNYRARLWSPAEARVGIEPLLRRSSLLFCGVVDAATIWGFTGEPADVAANLMASSGADTVVVTLGSGGALGLRREGPSVRQAAVPVPIVVDPVGAGDAFAAGYIDQWLDDPGDVQAALRSGVVLAALKMTVQGDHAGVSLAELRQAITLLDQTGIDIER